MSYVVVVADAVGPAGIELLSGGEFRVVSVAGRPERLKSALADADALIVRSETRVGDALLEAAPKLKVVARAGAGIDNIDVEAATKRGVAVLNTPGANTVSTAEHTLAMLLALQRRVPWAMTSLREGRWERNQFSGFELHGRTLGAVGLGRVGRHVAGLARAFGMSVSAHDPYVPEERARELGVGLIPLDDLLAGSDVVTLHLPLTDQTRHLIDARRLALMRPTSVLVNTARGGLVDEQALAEALHEGRLAGAALDVYEREPLPSDSPLLSAPRLVLTPHLAASTAEAQARVSLEACQAVRDALVHGDLHRAVNAPVITVRG